MIFASIYVPAFQVQSVVRLEMPLRVRAIALVDEEHPLRPVVAVNEAASRAGIAPGMTKSQTEQFCGVETRPRSRAQEKSAHAALLDLGWSVSPRVEDAARDTIVLDLTGLSRLLGSEEDIAKLLAERAVGLGFTVNIAVASRIETAIQAARGFPGITVIPAGEESRQLSALPVGVLFPSVDALETLQRWGVRTCGALAALPALSLSERLGQEGVRLHEAARGASERSLIPAELEAAFEENMELDSAVEDLESLAFLLGRLLDQLCARLSARALAARAVHVRFELEHPAKTYEKALTLPVPMRDSKLLLNLIRLQLQANPPPGPIQRIILAAEPARPRFAQNGLFIPVEPDPGKVELTIARLAGVVGESNVGSPELADTHRPAEFRITRFVVVKEAQNSDKDAPRMGVTAFRVFRPPLLAKVEVREGRPSRLWLQGSFCDVVAASGPWRTSGEWWREDAWEQDEWDVEIRFPLPSPSFITKRPTQTSRRSVYRIYYDAICRSWFVRGVYD